MKDLSEFWDTLVNLVDYKKWILRALRARARLTQDDELELLTEVVRRAACAAAAGRLPAKRLLGPWLSKTAENVLRESWRAQSREHVGLDALPEIASSEPSAEQQVIENDVWARIAAEVDRLPPALRDAYHLVKIEGYPPSEVCRMLQCGRTRLWENLREATKRLHAPMSMAFIEGVIVDQEQKIQKAAEVELFSSILLKRQVQSGGRFFFEWLRPARYQLKAGALGYRPESVDLWAHPGENALEIVLETPSAESESKSR